MAISSSGSGEGPGWVTAPGYSTAAFLEHVRGWMFWKAPRVARGGEMAGADDPTRTGDLLITSERIALRSSCQLAKSPANPWTSGIRCRGSACSLLVTCCHNGHSLDSQVVNVSTKTPGAP